MTEGLYQKIEKMYHRNVRKEEYYTERYKGKEEDHTFHGGWNLGYWQGRVSALEEFLDILEDCNMKPRVDIAGILSNYRIQAYPDGEDYEVSTVHKQRTE